MILASEFYETNRRTGSYGSNTGSWGSDRQSFMFDDLILRYARYSPNQFVQSNIFEVKLFIWSIQLSIILSLVHTLEDYKFYIC